MMEMNEDTCWNRKIERDEFDERCEFCPAYKARQPCWEFDWAALFRSISNPQIREMWRSYMRTHCLTCELYKAHEDAFRPRLEEIGAIITPKEVPEEKEKKRGLDLFT